MSIHTVSTVFNKNMSFTANINGHEVLMDTTQDDGGDNSGPSPKRLMLASLAGCTGIDVVSILNKMRVNFSDFSIKIDATPANEDPKIYKEVTITYQIRVAPGDESKVDKAVNLSKEKYCSVSAMFKAFATVKTAIIFLPQLDG